MKTRIYLAGGFRSNWQKVVIEKLGVERFDFYNPREHYLQSPKEYTTWDLHHVKKCDILLGYMEKDNPSGYGLALEIGYAKALNKTIILVNEKSIEDNKFENYFSIVDSSSDIVFKNIQDAIDYIKKY